MARLWRAIGNLFQSIEAQRDSAVARHFFEPTQCRLIEQARTNERPIERLPISFSERFTALSVDCC